MSQSLEEQITQLKNAITALEAQRAVLGDAVVEAALGPMRKQLAELDAQAQSVDHQRKQITVLFTDVVGSTKLGQQLADPEEILDLMDGALKRLAVPIPAHGGHVTRFMGDGFKAVFGLPVAHEDDAERAIRAGLELLQIARTIAAEIESTRRIAGFNVRVGINTGLVATGGFSESEDTVMGLTINLGARMESAAPPGGLLISHYTYQHVRGIFEMEALPPVTAKGFAEPVPVYLVKRAQPHAFRMATRGIEGIETRMVGRDAELLTLQDTWRDVLGDAQSRTLTVVGDAGVGKSRLLFEFEKWLPAQPEPTDCFRGRATAEMQAIAYSLIRDLFTFRFDIRESDSAATALGKFRNGMADTLDADKADLVGQLVGFDLRAAGSQIVNNLFGSDSFSRLASVYLTNYFRAITQARPTLILLEDIHWADDASLDLINNLVTAIPSARLLILSLTRPTLFERRPNWGEGRAECSRIDLKPLSRRHSRALVGELLSKVPTLPPDLCDLIVNGAEGNPYYLEELTRMLVDDGVIVRDSEQWRVEMERLARVRVPPTLTGVLQARLDGLPREERNVIQRASVVGREFWDVALALMSPEDQSASDTLPAALHALRERGMVLQREQSAFAEAHEFIFKHAILRDVIYETVLLKARRAYHAQVAAWLEKNAGKRVGEYWERIAYHYEMAGKPLKAVECLHRVGEEASEANLWSVALDVFQRALKLLPEDNIAQRAPLLIKAGGAYVGLTDLSPATQNLTQGLELARQVGNWKAELEALEGLAGVATFARQLDEAERYAEQQLALAQAHADPLDVAQALHVRAEVARWREQYARAQEYGNASLAIYREANQRAQIAGGLVQLGNIARGLQKIDEAVRYYQESLTLCREIGDRQRMTWGLTNLASIADKHGDRATAMQYLEECLTLKREIKDRMGEAVMLARLGDLEQDHGNLDAAENYLRQALPIVREIHSPLALVTGLITMGDIAIQRGKLDDAWLNYRDALSEAVAHGSTFAVPGILIGLAGVAAHRKQSAQAAEWISVALNQPTADSDTEDSAQQVLETLRPILAVDQLQAALARGKARDLDAVVKEILA